MSQVIQELQVKALKSHLAKIFKRHLRKFAKTTEMERSDFDELLQDWVWSLDSNSELMRLFEGYRQIGGGSFDLKINF
mgnify:CR=1 FL=1